MLPILATAGEQKLTTAEAAQKLEDERLHFRLESHVLSSRLAELNHRDSDIIHPEYPVVSPGSVVAVVEQTIAHSASSMPGLSGGAGEPTIAGMRNSTLQPIACWACTLCHCVFERCSRVALPCCRVTAAAGGRARDAWLTILSPFGLVSTTSDSAWK